MENNIHKETFSDEKYFEKIFKEYFKALTYYALKFTSDTDSAKEIVHLVFISMWERKEKIALDRSIKSYLYTAVHNRCLNHLRDKSRFHPEDAGDIDFLPEPDTDNTDALEQEESEARIAEAINDLPDRCAEVFRLSRFEGKKYREISSLLNISVKTVEAQMSKALRILREELKDLLTIIIIWILGQIM